MQDEKNFIYKACQALAFWIGYSKELYWQRDLVEFALSTEFFKLLNLNFKNGLKIFPEYKLEGSNERIDIVIKENEKTKYAIEIKREKANQKEIAKDFEKLKKIKNENKKIVCLLIVASQNKRPKNFVNKKGEAIRKTQYYNNKSKYSFKVIRVLKSSHTFRNLNSANYVCVLEIL